MNATSSTFFDWFSEHYATRMDNLQPGGASTMILATHTFSFPAVSLALYWTTILILPRLLKDAPERKLTVVMSLWNGFLFISSFIILLGVGIPYFVDIRNRGFFDVFCDPTQVPFSCTLSNSMVDAFDRNCVSMLFSLAYSITIRTRH